jgi:ATP-dependent DNA helicase DinG
MVSGGDDGAWQAPQDLLRLPVLVATHAGIWAARAGETAQSVSAREALRRAGQTPHLMLNAPVTADRLGAAELTGLDLLELFAFVHPARFAVPTPRGLAAALGMAPPGADADTGFLQAAAEALLGVVGTPGWAARHGAHGVLQAMKRHRWSWAPLVDRRLKAPAQPERSLYTRLEEWEADAPRSPPASVRIDPATATARLARIIGSEDGVREGQRAYAAAGTGAFEPREAAGNGEGGPRVVLAEAGTGIGKTLGYLAPAIVWAEAAGGSVWLSTYTRNLQRQLDSEAARVVGGADGRRRVVVRKGRENYLCLLNLEDAAQGGFGGRAALFAQLVVRWAEYSRDGDMVGGDLPGWLPRLFGRASFAGLTDRRGECIYAACPHFRRCFIEKSARASAQADLVIANHALVIVNVVRARAEGQSLTRLVFDEGHHLFDAADSMFSLALTGREAVELRNWLLGPPRATSGRRRGLAARLADIISYEDAAGALVTRIAGAAAALPQEGWLARIVEGEGVGAIEALLAAVRTQVLVRTSGLAQADAGYGLEADLDEPLPGLMAAALAAGAALAALAGPMTALAALLVSVLDAPPDWLDVPSRARVEGAVRGLSERAAMIEGWAALLARIGTAGDAERVDWLSVARSEGRDFDVGLHRHWLDPMKPFATQVLAPLHGALITSATLKGRAGDEAARWAEAERLTGARHLARPAVHFSVASPFDYAAAARVLIVTDVRAKDISGLAQAYRALIEAAGGGTLGLFTAISRLREVMKRIADPLARAGLPVYAQHVDPIDTGTLVDIFREEPQASLLGTDALRDGVDVPGQSLRLVVMEGVPWPRPTMLHKARRLAADDGAQAHDDRLTMGRLAQAFGRLIRRAEDRGHFVLMGAAMPSRLLAAFPEGTPIERVSLADAVAMVAAARDGLPSPPVSRHGAGETVAGETA